MTPQEAKKMLKAKLECLKNETSGINYDCNMRLCDGCSLNYEQGNMGEQKEALDHAIKALEQTKWIPVSERLPEERNYYLITVEIDGMNGCKPYYEIQTSWYSDKQFVVEYKGDGLIARRRVIAWMPLPEPYKAESEDNS